MLRRRLRPKRRVAWRQRVKRTSRLVAEIGGGLKSALPWSHAVRSAGVEGEGLRAGGDQEVAGNDATWALAARRPPMNLGLADADVAEDRAALLPGRSCRPPKRNAAVDAYAAMAGLKRDASAR
jgi:hypothetical protein